VVGTRQPAAAAGGGVWSAVVEAVRQPEERGAAVAGQRALRGGGGGLVRRRASGAGANRPGQLLTLRAARLLPGWQRLPAVWRTARRPVGGVRRARPTRPRRSRSVAKRRRAGRGTSVPHR